MQFCDAGFIIFSRRCCNILATDTEPSSQCVQARCERRQTGNEVQGRPKEFCEVETLRKQATGYAAGMFMSFFVVAIASAQGRYVDRPPVLVSPDLSAPWVLQLRKTPDAVQRPAGRAANYHSAPIRPDRNPPRTAQRRVHNHHANSQLRTAIASPRVAPVPQPSLDQKFLPQTVPYNGPHGPGTIVVDTQERFLYLVMKNGTARRYGVGVGKEGFGWKGTERITQKREWPDWRPPAEMIAREKKKGRILPAHMKGGINNPLGARALYLGSTLYRIHGTNAPWTIGQAVSSGCIRMRNEDVIDLYERVSVGAKVVVI